LAAVAQYKGFAPTTEGGLTMANNKRRKQTNAKCPKCGAKLKVDEFAEKCNRCGYFKSLEPSNWIKRLYGF
jgi:ribosomal protein L40E